MDKTLLIKDLSARLPYGVTINTPDGDGKLIGIVGYRFYTANSLYADIDCKPYLRRMSSMTEAEEKEYRALQYPEFCSGGYHYHDTVKSLDWLLAHHFDYRIIVLDGNVYGLIDLGIALDAPEDMYQSTI